VPVSRNSRLEKVEIFRAYFPAVTQDNAASTSMRTRCINAVTGSMLRRSNDVRAIP